MNVAILAEGVVTNIVVGPLPEDIEGIPVGDRPVAIGDTFADGVFLRNGEPVPTDAERIAELEAEVTRLREQLT